MSLIQEDFDKFYKVCNHINDTPLNLFKQVKDVYISLMLELSVKRNNTSLNDFQSTIESLKFQFKVYRMVQEYSTISLEESLKFFNISLNELKDWVKMDDDYFFEEFSKKDIENHPYLFELLNTIEEYLFMKINSRMNSDNNKDGLYRKFSGDILFRVYKELEEFFVNYYAVKLWHYIILNDQSRKMPKKRYEDLIWFRVGILFAKGKPYQIKEREPEMTFREMAVHFNFKESSHSYFSNSYGNRSKNDKNIFYDQKKIKRIKEYCTVNDIPICQKFQEEMKK